MISPLSHPGGKNPIFSPKNNSATTHAHTQHTSTPAQPGSLYASRFDAKSRSKAKSKSKSQVQVRVQVQSKNETPTPCRLPFSLEGFREDKASTLNRLIRFSCLSQGRPPETQLTISWRGCISSWYDLQVVFLLIWAVLDSESVNR
jgi:hypothetical protein